MWRTREPFRPVWKPATNGGIFPRKVVILTSQRHFINALMRCKCVITSEGISRFQRIKLCITNIFQVDLIVVPCNIHLQLSTSRMLPLSLDCFNFHSIKFRISTEVLHTTRSKWPPEPGRDYKFQAWDWFKLPAANVEKCRMWCSFFLRDFPCLKKKVLSVQDCEDNILTY